MKKVLSLLFFVFMNFVSLAQAPPNDNCSTATNLGTLPTPAACPTATGASVTSVGTNINATSPAVYTTLLGCQTGGNQPGPALDVWYTFVATGNMIVVNITPGVAPFLANPAITLWTGSCGSLVGMNCANNGSAGGVITATFQPTTPGTTYYLQVSGSTPTGAGNFNLSVSNNNDCNNCNTNSSLTYAPAPVGGTYPPNTTVSFCYKVITYNQVSANWLHGLTPTFGCGWDLTSIVPTPPPSCAGTGTWGWYNSNTSSANLTTLGPGFYYETSSGASCACVNANPGDNFGDVGAVGCTWSFCWTIKTKPNCACSNLNISLNTTGDGESGSWTSIACTGDPDYTFASSMNCCLVTATTTSVSCFGGTNGSATANPTGSAPFTYTWNSVPVQNTQTATNLPAGTYTVTVKDNVGCISTTTVVIAQPPVITVPITFVPATCASLNGSATANPTGGVGPYTYTWSTVPVQNTQTATGLGAGTFTCTVKDSHGCIKTGTVTVTSTGSITATATTTNISCFGGNDGSATANPAGTAPYTYTWSSVPIQNTQTATNLPVGVYTCTIKDGSGCMTTVTVSITQPPLLTVAVASTTNVTCFGGNNGAVNITVGGGTPAYTYTWNSVPVQNTQNATSLPAGSYTVTVKDSKGCIATTSVTITQPPTLTTSASNTGPYCAGQTISLSTPASTSYTWTGPSAFSSNAQNPNITNATAAMAGTYSVIVTVGSCTASATTNVVVNALPTPVAGNTGPYCPGNTIQLNVGAFTTYIWSGPSAFSSNAQNPTQANAQTTNSGNYTVTVSNAAGCTNTAVTNVVVNPTPVVVIGSNSPVCLNAAINLTSSGGTTYSWSGPNAFSSTLQNPTINPATAANAGVYTVTVTSLGCTNTGTVSVTVLSPTTSASNTGPYCAGQTISLSTPAATSYTWTGPSAFSSNAQNPTIANATAAMAGTYSVLVSAGTCTAVATTSVVVNALPIPIANSNSPICFGQTLNLTGTGGTTYTWTGPAFNSNLQNPSITNATTANSGNYVLTVTDVNGCKNTANTNVVVNPLPVIAVNNPTNCVNTTINLTSNGGVTYSWSGPNTFTSNAQNPSIPTAQLNMSGTYVVTVTDANGCINTASANVTVFPLPNPNITSNSPVCAGKTLNLFGTGGATYSWSGPGYTGPSQNPTINNVSAAANGVYTLLVSSGSCTASTTYTVVINPIPVFSFAGTNVLCNGQSNGTSTVNVTVGTGPYTYQWSTIPAQTTPNASGLTAGSYSCTVTDANGCVTMASTQITQPTQFSVAISSTTLSACAGSPINVNGSASGGIFPYTYNWIGGPATGAYSITEPLSGSYIYTLNATDANNCTAIANINLTYFPQPTVTATSATLCAGQTANLTASGAASYVWQPGNVTGSTYPYSGNTSVNVTVIGTANGCSNTTNANIIVNPNPNASISAGSNKGCAPSCVNFTAASTASIVSYGWTVNGVGISGAQSATYCFNEAATYTLGLNMIDQYGCTGNAPPISIDIYNHPVADFNHAPIKPIVNIDQEVTFTDASYGANIISWNWYFMNTAQYTSTQQNPTFSYTEPGTYVVALVVKSDKGCIDTILRPLVVGEDFGIYVPNAFTPNADGVNDVFQPKGFGIVKYELNIFDRWGERMFHTTTFEEGWDGTIKGRTNKIIEEGSYTWLIDCTDVFGKAHELKGHVILMK